MKNHTKIYRRTISMGLIILVVILIIGIYSITRSINKVQTIKVKENDDIMIEVEQLDVDNSDEAEIKDGSVIGNDLVVMPIIIDDDKIGIEITEDINIIAIPLPEVPTRPDNEEPDYNPVTVDDITDLENEPGYNEDQTIYIPEPDTEPEEQGNEPSNLVPDSENPFLQDNIPENGDGGEFNGEDLGDGEWGAGDMF